MTLLELLIIYLSIGAPFGVLAFFSNRGDAIFRLSAKSLGTAAFWPYTLFLAVYRRITAAENSQLRWTALENEIEAALRRLDPPLGKETRNLLENYVTSSLAEVRTGGFELKNYYEYLDIAGNSHPSIGASCLQRRRNKQLSGRLDRFRKRLLDAIEAEDRVPDEQNRHAIALICERLGDADTAEHIRSSHRKIDLPQAAVTRDATVTV